MPLPVLVRVCCVPFKTGAAIEEIARFRHITEYISAIYTKQDEPAQRSATSSKVAYRKRTSADLPRHVAEKRALLTVGGALAGS
jgi:hypothetical protein